MPPKKHPLSVWIAETFYEDNAVFGRRASRIPGLLRKILLTVPHAIAFVFTNFSSGYPRRNSSADPVPVRHLPVDLILENWPRHPDTNQERGLPFSDGSLRSIDVQESLNVVSDLVFAMKEIHRVCAPDAVVTLSTERRDPGADPTIIRTVTAGMLTFFTDQDHPLKGKAERAGVAGLFRSAGEGKLLAIKNAALASPSKIDIGSGTQVHPGYAGIDIFPLPGVAIVRDVDRHGLPFSDSTVTHVYTAHFLEHTSNLVFIMNEIHRVCCHDALVEINVPILLGPYAAADPTHRRLFNARTFSYFEKDGTEYAGITKGFEILEQHVGFSMVTRLRVVKSDQEQHRQQDR